MLFEEEKFLYSLDFKFYENGIILYPGIVDFAIILAVKIENRLFIC